jgi:hypothetical protein
MDNLTDIVIHINENLDNQHRIDLSKEVLSISGVSSASVQEKRPHLMIIAYNAAETKAYEVLNNVRKTGMHAQLVGWL